MKKEVILLIATFLLMLSGISSAQESAGTLLEIKSESMIPVYGSPDKQGSIIGYYYPAILTQIKGKTIDNAASDWLRFDIGTFTCYARVTPSASETQTLDSQCPFVMLNRYDFREALSVHCKPTDKSDAITSLVNGQLFQVLGHDKNGWFHILVDGEFGFIKANPLEILLAGTSPSSIQKASEHPLYKGAYLDLEGFDRYTFEGQAPLEINKALGKSFGSDYSVLVGAISSRDSRNAAVLLSVNTKLIFCLLIEEHGVWRVNGINTATYLSSQEIQNSITFPEKEQVHFLPPWQNGFALYAFQLVDGIEWQFQSLWVEGESCYAGFKQQLYVSLLSDSFQVKGTILDKSRSSIPVDCSFALQNIGRSFSDFNFHNMEDKMNEIVSDIISKERESI